MDKTILLVLIGKRRETAVSVQKILTEWGCIIKTRLGLHDGVMEDCSNQGLLICELVGTQEQRSELARKVALLPGVTSQLINLPTPLEEETPL
jgi:hypothetical protein